MISANKVSLNFVKYLALDEADNILDLGLEKQTKEIILERDLPRKEDRVTVMFSATFPLKIRELAKSFLRRHVFISVGKTGSTADGIQQEVKWVEEASKRNELLKDLQNCLNQPGKIIIFVAKRQSADRLSTYLNKNNLFSASIHGKQNQYQRETTIMRFKDDQFRVLCATSVAARGLDFPDISLVVNYDFPQSLQDYTHRIGRTGRIGSSGRAISYFNHSNMGLSGRLRNYLHKHKQRLPHWLAKMRGGRRR